MLDPTIKSLASSGRNFAALSFHAQADGGGAIASHVMWIDADDEHVLVNTEVHRFKYRAMTANPDVTVTVMSSDNPYVYGEVRGRVVGEVRGPAARAHIDELSERYTGHLYQGEIKSERVILQVEPVRQRMWGA